MDRYNSTLIPLNLLLRDLSIRHHVLSPTLVTRQFPFRLSSQHGMSLSRRHCCHRHLHPIPFNYPLRTLPCCTYCLILLYIMSSGRKYLAARQCTAFQPTRLLIEVDADCLIAFRDLFDCKSFSLSI